MSNKIKKLFETVFQYFRNFNINNVFGSIKIYFWCLILKFTRDLIFFFFFLIIIFIFYKCGLFLKGQLKLNDLLVGASVCGFIPCLKTRGFRLTHLVRAEKKAKKKKGFVKEYFFRKHS